MTPLAIKLRPQNLAEFVGQEHLVGKNKPLRLAITKKQIFSMIFWGPPGSGKTTLARIIARENGRAFHELSAVSAGKADVRRIVQESEAKQKDLLQKYQAPILFLDEIHRFNKAQQDYLLPFVEDGSLILIGATTENPSFEIIAPLLSRTRIFVLKKLSEENLLQIIKNLKLKIGNSVSAWLINYASGDARKLLTLIDNCLLLYPKITLANLKSTLQSSQLSYDKKGEEHYNTISAFIKSMRASQTDAALYYLARMVAAGEDPKFIARRMVIFASEDIGLAQPTALVVANAVFDAVRNIGYPEAQINLAHGVAYLCKCTKDRSAYDAYFKALADVEKYGNLPIPLHILNAPTKLLKSLNYGKGYQMYDQKDLPAGRQGYLPEKLEKKKYLL